MKCYISSLGIIYTTGKSSNEVGDKYMMIMKRFVMNLYIRRFMQPVLLQGKTYSKMFVSHSCSGSGGVCVCGHLLAFENNWLPS